VRDDQLPVIEDVMADETVEKGRNGRSERVRLALELRERVREAMRDLHIPTTKFADELGIVVAGDAERVAARHHAHDEPQYSRNPRPAIDEVTRKTALRPSGGVTAIVSIPMSSSIATP